LDEHEDFLPAAFAEAFINWGEILRNQIEILTFSFDPPDERAYSHI
jgi:hypothetical protein